MWHEEIIQLLDRGTYLIGTDLEPNEIATTNAKWVLTFASALDFPPPFRIVPTCAEGWAIRFHNGDYWCLIECYDRRDFAVLLTNRKENHVGAKACISLEELFELLRECYAWLYQDISPDWMVR